MPADHLATKIEELCQQGCQYVNSVIEKLEHKQPVEELKGFSHEDKRRILESLNDIMSAYTDKNDK